MKPERKKTTRVLWAVDPANPRKDALKRVSEVLDRMGRDRKLEIEAVSVLNPFDIRLAASAPPRDNRVIQEAIVDKVNSALKQVNGGVKRAKILVSPTYSFQSLVGTFLKYAKESGAQLIVVSSFSKGVVDRFVLGSFAEALTLKSDIPVLVVHPRSRVSTGTETILFPTDFSKDSKKALGSLVRSLPPGAKSHLVLFHQFEVPLSYSPEPFAALPVSQAAIDAEERRVRRLGERWVKQVTQKGIEAEFVLNREGSFAAKSILKLAQRKHPSMIALASRKGALGVAFLGSTSRQVLRRASCPVWVMHFNR